MRKIKHIIQLLVAVMVFSSFTPNKVEVSEPEHFLFKINRSRDADEIWYTVNLDKSGVPDKHIMNTIDFSNLSATYVNCMLKKSPAVSHTQGLMDVSMNIMKKENVRVNNIRLVDYDIAPGVYPDMTKEGWEKDEWPELFKTIFDSDILIIGTPIWLGEKSSVAQKLIGRLYSMSGELNDKGQYIYYGKVGSCIITGNEDGVKHCAMGMLYAMQHIGYSIPRRPMQAGLAKSAPGPAISMKVQKPRKMILRTGIQHS